MKKIIVFAFALVFCAIATNAQIKYTGSLDGPFSEGKMNVTIDYSKALLKGYTEAELLEADIELKDEWVAGKREIFERFLEGLRKYSKGVFNFGSYTNTRYTFTLYPTSIKDKGTLNAIAEVIDNTTGDCVARLEGLHGDGGRWGTFTNLLGDGIEELGEYFGHDFVAEYKKFMRKNKR